MEPKKYTNRLDASETIFFGQQIEQVSSKTYDVKYGPLKGLQLIPAITDSVDPGASNFVYRQFDQAGVAKLIASYADDLPRVDVKAKEFTAPIRSLGAAYGYSIQEIRSAKMAGIPLEQRKANAARRAIDEKIDNLVQSGDSTSGMGGAVNVTNALSYSVPNGALGTATFATKTALEMLKDLNGIANYIVQQTKEAEKPDTLVLPLAQFQLIATTPMANNNNTTVLELYLQTNPYIRNVEAWNALQAAGAGPTDRMMCYRRDPDAIGVILPVPFEQFEPEKRNLEYVIDCHGRCGGVVAFYPLSVAYGDGI